MIVDAKYMSRCIQLAMKGRGYTSPNPMVGAVVVHDGLVIGEGYHKKYGEVHAEVNAINSVRDKSLLKDSTLYVSLEPCSHYGKTPPCAQLIIDSKIPRVVVGSLDPFPEVAGRGVKMLENAGIITRVGMLRKECEELNKEFITFYTKNRPYIYLKWAQSNDGYMDKKRSKENTKATPISNDFTKILVHKLRAETDAIMVGTNTAILDNPSLTTRHWYGKNPTRFILDRKMRVPENNLIFNSEAHTYIVTEENREYSGMEHVESLCINYDESFLNNLLKIFKEKMLLSVMIEGGAKLLQFMIDNNMWDEAYVEVSSSNFGAGVVAPDIRGELRETNQWKDSKQLHFYALHA